MMDSENRENRENGMATQNKPFEFTGKGGEFFAIWIVNVALTILTLGIYSAWAKVRTHQYFYGNTLLDGISFRYTASPIQILKGRLVAFVVFMAYYVLSGMSPLLAGGAFVILMLLVPAFMVLSMTFRLRNSVYRNVRFNFKKNFRTAYKVFAVPVIVIGAYVFIVGLVESSAESNQGGQLFLPLAMVVLVIAIAVLFPWWEFMITQFKVVHSKYGSSGFSFSASVKDYYMMYLKMFGFMFLFFMLAGILVALFMSQMETKNGVNEMGDAGIMTPVLLFLMFPAYLWLFAYIQAKRTNLVYNNIDIDGNKVKSDLKTGYLLYLYITNTLAMMLTLGLLMPWAKVRTARYRASVTSVDFIVNLDQFTSAQAEQQSAIGEEIGEMFDMDLGF